MQPVASTTTLREGLRDLLICPISHETMENPVIDPCGHSFEELQIQGWLSLNPTCPLSKRPVSIEQLVPNRMLKQALEILAHAPDPYGGSATETANLSITVQALHLSEEDRAVLDVAIDALRRQREADAQNRIPNRLDPPQNFAARVKTQCKKWYSC